MNLALADAAVGSPAHEISALVGSRTKLGFEGVTDFIFGMQPVVTAAITRPELRSIASTILAGVSRRSARAHGLSRKNARLFVSRMRVELERAQG